MQQRKRRHQAADPDQKVSVGHSLNEVTCGVMVQQGGAMKDENDYQIAGDDEYGQKDDDPHFQEANRNGFMRSHTQKAKWTAAIKSFRGRVHCEISKDIRVMPAPLPSFSQTHRVPRYNSSWAASAMGTASNFTGERRRANFLPC